MKKPYYGFRRRSGGNVTLQTHSADNAALWRQTIIAVYFSFPDYCSSIERLIDWVDMLGAQSPVSHNKKLPLDHWNEMFPHTYVVITPGSARNSKQKNRGSFIFDLMEESEWTRRRRLTAVNPSQIGRYRIIQKAKPWRFSFVLQWLFFMQTSIFAHWQTFLGSP